jgi:hypothetical protein
MRRCWQIATDVTCISHGEYVGYAKFRPFVRSMFFLSVCLFGDLSNVFFRTYVDFSNFFWRVAEFLTPGGTRAEDAYVIDSSTTALLASLSACACTHAKSEGGARTQSCHYVLRAGHVNLLLEMSADLEASKKLV